MTSAIAGRMGGNLIMKAHLSCIAAVLSIFAVPATPANAANPPAEDGNRLLAATVPGRAFHSVRPLRYARPYWRGSVYRHSSTPAESFARGAAALIWARADYNLQSAEARIAAAAARDRELDNRKKQVATYFHVRELNRAGRAIERGPNPTQEDLARYAQAGRPKPLSPSELNATTGKVFWPVLLKTGQYAEYRAALDKFSITS